MQLHDSPLSICVHILILSSSYFPQIQLLNLVVSCWECLFSIIKLFERHQFSKTQLPMLPISVINLRCHQISVSQVPFHLIRLHFRINKGSFKPQSMVPFYSFAESNNRYPQPILTPTTTHIIYPTNQYNPSHGVATQYPTGYNSEPLRFIVFCLTSIFMKKMMNTNKKKQKKTKKKKDEEEKEQKS